MGTLHRGVYGLYLATLVYTAIQINHEVPEPYMVSSSTSLDLISSLPHSAHSLMDWNRMRYSMSSKHKHSVKVDGVNGMEQSLRLQVCS